MRSVTRLGAALLHFGGSALLALISAVVVFFVWYPNPYYELAGGLELFLIMISVDVVLGPALTFVVFNPKKAASALRRDLLVIVLLQISALVYGMNTVANARPVYLAFEYSLFRVVRAVEVDPAELAHAPESLRDLSWTGPKLLSLRAFSNGQESFDATMTALNGMSLAAQPRLWQPYSEGREAILQASKPLGQLRQSERVQSLVGEFLRSKKLQPDQLVYLPMMSNKDIWIAVMDKSNADIVGYLPIDPY